MQTGKKKPFWALVVFGVLLAIYIGYLVGGAWTEDATIFTFLPNLITVIQKPFGNHFNQYTTGAIVIMLVIYLFLMLLYYTGKRNYMPGKEYGTAKFISPKAVSKKLKDKDDNYNRILSQNLRISLNTRYTGLNNNVLIIGGSGAGKTFFEVKPNLMEMPRNCSFVITDPKGGVRRSHLKRVGTAQI